MPHIPFDRVSLFIASCDSIYDPSDPMNKSRWSAARICLHGVKGKPYPRLVKMSRGIGMRRDETRAVVYGFIFVAALEENTISGHNRPTIAVKRYSSCPFTIWVPLYAYSARFRFGLSCNPYICLNSTVSPKWEFLIPSRRRRWHTAPSNIHRVNHTTPNKLYTMNYYAL